MRQQGQSSKEGQAAKNGIKLQAQEHQGWEGGDREGC